MMASSYFVVWPYLEVFDLTNNRIGDISQVEFLWSGNFVKSKTCRIVAVKGNPFEHLTRFTTMGENHPQTGADNGTPMTTVQHLEWSEKLPSTVDITKDHFDVV